MVLEEQAEVSKLAREKSSLKINIGHLDPGSAKRDWGSKGLNRQDCRAFGNPLELVVEHDLISIRVELLGVTEVEIACKPLLIRNFRRRDSCTVVVNASRVA